MKKIICTSDTHGSHWDVNVPDGDIFVFAGDYTAMNSTTELEDFSAWLNTLQHEHKIFVPGNHDPIFQTNESLARESLPEDVTCLIHEGCVIDGIKFWGSPYSLPFCNWAFMYPENELKKLWAEIPKNTDVLITHGPPYDTGDTTHEGIRSGSVSLTYRVAEIIPILHIFGHIHEGYSITEQVYGTFSANCSRGIPPMKNPPMTIEYI